MILQGKAVNSFKMNGTAELVYGKGAMKTSTCAETSARYVLCQNAILTTKKLIFVRICQEFGKIIVTNC